MKKIMMVLCALSLIMSASAANQDNNRLPQRSDKVTVDRNAVPAPSKGKIHKAYHGLVKDASVTVNNLTAISLANYYEEDGLYAFDFYNDDDLVLDCMVYAPANNKIEDTYAISDGYYVAGAGDTVTVDGTLTLTYSSMGADGYYVYTATASLTEVGGSRSFSFTNEAVSVWAIDYMYYMYCQYYGVYCDQYEISLRDAPVQPATDTISLLIPSGSFEDYSTTDGDYYFMGYTADESYGVSIDYFGSQITGSYVFADFYEQYTMVYDLTNEVRIDVLDGNLTVSATADGYSLDAYLLGDDAHCYHVLMTYVIPYAQDTVNITVSDATLTDRTATNGVFQFMGETMDYQVGVALYGSSVAGTYTNDDFYTDYTFIVDLTTGDEPEFYSGDATVTTTTDGYQLQAYILCTDLHCYHITMNYAFPVAEDTVELVIPTSELEDYSAYDGSYLFFGYTADQQYAAEITYYSNQITGNFTYADFDPSYTAIVDMANQVQLSVFDGNLTVTATAAGYHLNAYLLCTDNHCYHVSMDYSIPVAQDTININIPDAQLTDYTADAGVFQFMGESADYQAGIAIYSDQLVGNYTEADFYADYTFIYNMVSGEEASVYTGHASVTAISNGYRLEAYILCTDNHCYHVVLDATNSAINDVENVNVTIYPNPATEKLNVVAEGVKEINIIDVNGRTVMTRTQAGSIDVSALANGVYMVRTITNEGVSVKRIVKK